MKWLVFAMLILAWCSSAHGHDHWINAGRYRSPVDGSLCCGKFDCKEIPTKEVKITAAGYFIPKIGEVIPFKEALPSEDGQYHRCHRYDGSRRCFFAPQPGT